VREDNVREDNVREDNVREDNVRENNVRKDNVRKDNVRGKSDSVKGPKSRYLPHSRLSRRPLQWWNEGTIGANVGKTKSTVPQ
jgi:hypothetical protein